MICYIKDTSFTEEKKLDLQAKHEFFFSLLENNEGFKKEKNLENKDIFIPNKKGIKYLRDVNEKFGKVYGIKKALTSKDENSVTVNVLNLNSISSSVIDFLDFDKNSPYYNLSTKVQDFIYDFEIKDFNFEDKVNFKNSIFVDKGDTILFNEDIVDNHIKSNGLNVFIKDKLKLNIILNKVIKSLIDKLGIITNSFKNNVNLIDNFFKKSLSNLKDIKSEILNIFKIFGNLKEEDIDSITDVYNELNIDNQQVIQDNEGVFQLNGLSYDNKTNQTIEQFIAEEQTIRDLSHNLSKRIGIEIILENDKDKKYKGKISNKKAYINLAYATLDTPIHEIIGHPIIRHIKETNKSLYQNLLKELKVGKGKEVLDKVKKTYTAVFEGVNKFNISDYVSIIKLDKLNDKGENLYVIQTEYLFKDKSDVYEDTVYSKEYTKDELISEYPELAYTSDELNEEALVELLGLLTAGKLLKNKDRNLISVLRELLSTLKSYVLEYLKKKEIKVSEIPDNFTLNDLSDLIGYSKSKFILSNSFISYTTPDNKVFKTYDEANEHLTKLAQKYVEYDLDSVTEKDIPYEFLEEVPQSLRNLYDWLYNNSSKTFEQLIDEKDWYFNDPATLGTDVTKWIIKSDTFKYSVIYNDNGDFIVKQVIGNTNDVTRLNEKDSDKFIQENKQEILNNLILGKSITDKLEEFSSITKENSFVEKNYEYEKSKHIVETWIKLNNIIYNPNEIYSRNAEFISISGAYGFFDTKLMIQNLLNHIQDSKKIKDKIYLSCIIKDKEKKSYLDDESKSSVIYKIYPKSEDIIWAAKYDVYSGSIWDSPQFLRAERFGKERAGVIYTKYPSINTLNYLTPNLLEAFQTSAEYPELGIALTENNFRLSYEINTPLEVKELVDNFNNLMDSKFGKLEEPIIDSDLGEINPTIYSKDLQHDISTIINNVNNSDINFYDKALKNIKMLKLKEFSQKYYRLLISTKVNKSSDFNFKSRKIDEKLLLKSFENDSNIKKSENFESLINSSEISKISINEIGIFQKVVEEEKNESLKLLEEKLINNFLKDFNVTVTEYQSIKESLGFDAYSAFDLITKSLVYETGNPITKEVSYFAYYLLGKNNNKIKSNLNYLINKWDKYSERFNYHSNIIRQKEGFISDKKEWKSKVKELVIIDFLEETLFDYYKNPKSFEKQNDSKWTSEDFTAWENFLKWCEKVLNRLKINLSNKKELLNKIGLSIVDEILNNNYQYFNYDLAEGQIQKFYNETISQDKKAENIINFGVNNLGFKLTGSLALRNSGSIFRTENESLHDIDFIVPHNLTDSENNKRVYEEIKDKVSLIKEARRNNDYANNLEVLDLTELIKQLDWYENFIKANPNYKIINSFFTNNDDKIESLTIQGVIDGEFYEEDGFHTEKVSFFKKNKDTKKPEKISVDKKVFHKKGDLIKDTGYIIDFFVRLKDTNDTYDGFVNNWKEIMKVKIQWGREKDLIDYKAFVPFRTTDNKFNFEYSTLKHYNFVDNTNNETLNQEKLLQLNSNKTIPQSNEDIVNILKQRLKEIYPEFNLELLDKLPNGVNGLVDFAHSVVQIQKGEETALSEEFAHILLELHPDKQKFLDLAESTKLYSEVYQEYSLYNEYWKGGKVNKDLIKKEVAAKLLAQAIFSKSTNDWSQFNNWVSPRRTKNFITEIKKLLRDFINFIKGVNIEIFKEAAQSVIDGNISRIDKTSSTEVLFQTNDLKKDTFEALKRFYNTVEFLDVNDEGYEDEKGKLLMKKINNGFSILKDNLDLSKNIFNSQSLIPLTEFATMKNTLLRLNNYEDNLKKVSKSFIDAMEVIQKFSKFSVNQIDNADYKTLIKLSRFSSQWQSYLLDLENETNSVEGDFYDYLQDIQQSLKELDKKLNDKFNDITLKIFEDHIKKATEENKLRYEAYLKENFPEFANSNLLNKILIYFKENGKDLNYWNYIIENNLDKTVLFREVIKLGKIENRELFKTLDLILENTFSQEIIKQIIQNDSINGLESLFLGASSSSDSIIAIFQNIIDDSKIQSTELAKEIIQEFMTPIEKLYKELKMNHLEIGKRLTVDDVRIVGNKKVETYSYLNDVKEEAYIIKREKWKQLSEIKKQYEAKKISKQEYFDAVKEYEDYLAENWYQDFTPEFYEAKNNENQRLKDSHSIQVIDEANRMIAEIWNNISSIQKSITEIENGDDFILPNGEINPLIEEMEKNIELLYTEYKKLSSPYDENGLKENTNEDVDSYKIYKYLSDKKLINSLYRFDVDILKFRLSLKRWLFYLEKSNKEEFNSPEVQSVISFIDSPKFLNPDNLDKNLKKIFKILSAYNIAQIQKGKKSLLFNWFKKNTNQNPTEEFYADRKVITDRISLIIDSINLHLGRYKTDNTEKWKEVLLSLKVYKDNDNTINGELVSEIERKHLLEFEIDLRSYEDRSNGGKADKRFMEEKIKQLKEQIALLDEIQSKDTTIYYDNIISSALGISGEEFLESIKGIDNLNDLESHLLESFNSKDELENFLNWFSENHYLKPSYEEDAKGKTTKIYSFVPILVWNKTSPINEHHIKINFSNKFTIKTVKEDFIEDVSNKDAFGRWKPRRYKYLDGQETNELTGLHNEDFYKLKESNNREDKILFEILEKLKEQHINSQYKDQEFINTYPLYFIIPQKEKETFEDISGIGKTFLSKLNGQQQSTNGRNFSDNEQIEDEKKTSNRLGLAAKFFSNMLKKKVTIEVPKDYRGERYFRPSLRYYNHVEKSVLSRDILFSQLAFIEASKIHQGFKAINPKSTIIYKSLKSLGVNDKRLTVVENIMDREVQGINKLYELGLFGDKLISWFKKMGTWRSQLLFNLKGGVKNRIAGTGNLWVNSGMISDGNIIKAERTFLSKWFKLKTQLLGNEPKDDYFKIVEYFIPRVEGNYKFYAVDRLKRVFLDGSFASSAQEEGEFQIYGTTLELFLETKYKNGKLRDFIKVLDYTDVNGNIQKKVILGQGAEEEMQDLRDFKKRFNEIMRFTQGNQGMQKSLTESNRYTFLSAVMFFRNYLPQVIINRFGRRKTNFTLNVTTEGYYRTFLREFFFFLKDLKNIKKQWASLQDFEKVNFIKCLKEIAVMVIISLLLMMLGYDDDDKNRFKKIRNNNYLHNLILYELLTSYQEIIGLSIFRGTDLFHEAMSNVKQTSLAFGEVGKITNILENVYDTILDNEDAYYKTSDSFHKKGDSVLLGNINKITPFNNFTGTFSNEKLADQIKYFVLTLERN